MRSRGDRWKPINDKELKARHAAARAFDRLGSLVLR